MNKKKIFLKVLIIINTIYILWRLFFTLPLKNGLVSLILGLLVYVIEIVDYISTIIFCKNIKDDEPESQPNIENNINKNRFPNVDILILTINEKKELLEKTIKACKDLEYPNKSKIHIYLCDDGNRKEIEQLAKEEKINYIKRTNNENFKAGNLNNALKYTKSEYFAVLDADMVPEKDFLVYCMNEILKEDEGKLAFVQVPQDFYNYNIIQNRLGVQKYIPDEQSFFYKHIQCAKNKNNTVIYCGTNAVFLKKAILEIGGFATKSITEDIATGMLLQNKGYYGKALSTSKVYGLAVNNLESYLKQRKRWAIGSLQLAKNYNILKQDGLSKFQKLEYIDSINYWLFPIKRIIFLLLPIIFVFFNTAIINANVLVFAVMCGIMYFLKRYLLDIVLERRHSFTWDKIIEIIISPYLLIEIIKEIFRLDKAKFEVSKKDTKTNKQKTNKRLIISHFLIWVLSIISIFHGINKMNSTNYIYYIFSMLWLISNIFYLTIALKFDLFPKENIEKYKYENIEKYNIKSILKIFKKG